MGKRGNVILKILSIALVAIIVGSITFFATNSIIEKYSRGKITGFTAYGECEEFENWECVEESGYGDPLCEDESNWFCCEEELFAGTGGGSGGGFRCCSDFIC
tara:strand:- start:293 stop:601 length:309 start_codon:yes stop_codon:yes gene_type:complete